MHYKFTISILSFIIDGQTSVRAPCIEKLESTIGEIHKYFSRSAERQFQLKSWQTFMEIPVLKFKRIFDIRWSSIKSCIEPIIHNVEPGLYIQIIYDIIV